MITKIFLSVSHCLVVLSNHYCFLFVSILLKIMPPHQPFLLVQNHQQNLSMFMSFMKFVYVLFLSSSNSIIRIIYIIVICLYLHMCYIYIYDRMPQIYVIFRRKSLKHSVTTANILVIAHTPTRQGVDSDYYVLSMTEVLISHSFSVETISIEPGSKPSSLEFVSILQEW